MPSKLYSIGMAATANDNKSLKGAISTLERDLREYPLNGSAETVLCLNNHNAETENIANRITRDYPYLGLKVISSEPGLIHAQKKIIQETRGNSDFVIFYDADVSIGSGTTKNLVRFMEDHPEVKAASGDQIAIKIDNFWYGVYNIIGLNPKLMTPRKYLTGKDFAIRKEFYYVPEFMLTEDTFLSHHLIAQFGEEAVQAVPNAFVRYIGPRTFRDYFNKIRRLDIEREKMLLHYPNFKLLEIYFKKTRILEEVSKLSLKEKAQLVLHDLIVTGCKKGAKFSSAPTWVPLNSTKDERLFEE